MSGPGSCSAVHKTGLPFHTLRTWCTLQAAQTRPQLPFLYPALAQHRHVSQRTRVRRRKKADRPPKTWDGYVRKMPVDAAPNLGLFQTGTPDNLHDAIDALRSYQQDVARGPLMKAAQPFRAERPESPLFRILKKSKRNTKLQNKKIFDNTRVPTLHFSPWANILAERIRSCPASGSRLPVALLTGWGLVRHPEEKNDIYLLPTELADLATLDLLGERAATQSSKAREKSEGVEEIETLDTFSSPYFLGKRETEDGFMSPTFQEVGQVVDGDDFAAGAPYDATDRTAVHDDFKLAELDRLTKSSPPPSQTESPSSPVPVRMLPHLNLVKQLTLQMNAADPVQRRLRTTRKSVVRLLPQSFKSRLEEFAHYRKLRRIAERQSGVVSRTSVPKEAEIDIEELKWQGDVAGRMLTLMRERVLLVVKRILELESTKTKRRRVQIWSEDFLRDAHARSEAEQEPAPELPKEAAIFPESGETTRASDSIPARQREHQFTRNKALRSTQSRMYLHFGPYPSAAINDLTTTLHGRPTPQMAEHYLPPMLPASATSDQQTFPFIPLLPLLGASQHATLRTAILECAARGELTTYGAIDIDIHPSDGDTPVTDGMDGQQSFTLVVKASAWHANSLFREVWQLWRYVGGRAALQMWEAGLDVASEEVVGDPRLVKLRGAGEGEGWGEGGRELEVGEEGEALGEGAEELDEGVSGCAGGKVEKEGRVDLRDLFREDR